MQGIGYDLKRTDYFEPYDIYAEKESVFLFEIEAGKLPLPIKQVPQELTLANLEISYMDKNDIRQVIELSVKVEITDEEVQKFRNDHQPNIDRTDRCQVVKLMWKEHLCYLSDLSYFECPDCYQNNGNRCDCAKKEYFDSLTYGDIYEYINGWNQ